MDQQEPKAAVVGWPARHSLSPLIMKSWLDETAQSGDYSIIECPPESFEQTVRRRLENGFVGVNVTAPHKQAALKLADHVSPSAKAIGAANVLHQSRDGLYADNTDLVGVAHALEPDSGQGAAVLIGAGGAARAALHHLKNRTGPVRILNRTRAHAERVCAELGVQASVHTYDDPAVFSDVGLVINASTLGMRNHPELDVDLSACRSDALVFDMVYTPLNTGFLRQAQTLGLRTSDGLRMLIGQARPAFESFFGAPAPDHDDVRNILLAHLEAG